MVHRISRDLIDVPPRQRSERSPEDVPRLAASILSKGLLHPPVFRPEGSRFILVAGETRLLAIEDIGKRNQFFQCNGEVYLPGEVPGLLLENLSSVQFAEAELEENLIRTDLPWQDRVRAIDAIHKMREAANPHHTEADTVREIVAKGGIAGGPQVAGGAMKAAVHEARVVAANLHDPQIRKARNASEAYQLVVQREEAAFGAELIRRKMATSPGASDWTVRKGSLVDILPGLDPGTFDLIVADPPYGISADSAGFRGRTVHHHNYSDSPDEARKLVQAIILEGFRITKPRANLFLFCDIDLFPWAKTMCQQAGWSPFRTPLIWQKSDSEGLAPWGKQGPRRTYELILFATKGQRGLIASPTDILRFNRVSRADREYGPEKPAELITALIECSTLPGDSILDPCCGAGSSIEAARRSRRKALGIEVDPHAFDLALRRANGDALSQSPTP